MGALRISVAAVVLMFTGCAHSIHAKPMYAIPPSCILGGWANVTECNAINADEADCNHVRVKFACVKAIQHENGK